MENNYSWFFDVFALAIILFYLYIGGKKGFVKTLLYFAGYVISFALAFWVSNNLSTSVYDAVIKDNVTNTIESKLDNFNASDEIKRILNNSFGKYGISVTSNDVENAAKNPDKSFIDSLCTKINASYPEANVNPQQLNSILNDFTSSGIFSPIISSISNELNVDVSNQLKEDFNLDSYLKNICSDKKTAAQFIESKFIRNNVIAIVKFILFVISFFICMTIVRILCNMISFVNRVPLIGPANAILGGVLGILEGLLVVYIISIIIKIIITLSSGNMLVFNSNTVENTIIFKHIYNINLFTV